MEIKIIIKIIWYVKMEIFNSSNILFMIQNHINKFKITKLMQKEILRILLYHN